VRSAGQEVGRQLAGYGFAPQADKQCACVGPQYVIRADLCVLWVCGAQGLCCHEHAERSDGSVGYSPGYPLTCHCTFPLTCHCTFPLTCHRTFLMCLIRGLPCWRLLTRMAFVDTAGGRWGCPGAAEPPAPVAPFPPPQCGCCCSCCC
jgi:hypothetical protein